jgi:lipopolysaccharide transport system ATP-binding protein
MSDVVVRAENLGKRYRIGERQPYLALRDVLARSLAAPFRWFQTSKALSNNPRSDGLIWALKDVCFEVRQGEVLGIIGRNGAGKSTLLKILSRITEPTEGYAEIRGRVGSLLEVGTGFHPELTGRENIYLNGAILGMTRAEIKRKLDEIVAFAEIEKFIDTPVKRYSSGMYVRLAFAVAAHLEPEILLVDEVLAVGDASFQKKCLGKMDDVVREGRTVLFVSHNMAAVRNLCLKCILLESGRITHQGETGKVIEAYLCNRPTEEVVTLETRSDRRGSGIIRFTSVSFRGRDGRPRSSFLSGEDLEINLAYHMHQQLPDASKMQVAVGVNDIYGDCLFLCTNDLTNEITEGWPFKGGITCQIRRLPLSSGLYKINIYAAVNGEVADWIVDSATFEVQSDDFFGTGRLPPSSHGRFLVPHSWTFDPKSNFPTV